MTRPAIELATEDDDEAIRSLLRREPMPGRIQVTFEREPNFWLGCGIAEEDCNVLVARDLEANEVVGLACRSTRRLFVNGTVRRLGYFSQLRIDSRFRGRWLVSRGFARLKRLHDAGPLPAYLVSIIEGNREAVGVLVERRRRGFPDLHPISDFRTLAILVNRARPALRNEPRILPARTSDLDAVARFLNLHGSNRQFALYWAEESLAHLAPFGLRAEDFRIARRGDRIVGVAALWDQSSFKQTVVHKYSGWLKFAAPLYNRASPVLGRNKLPRPGEKILSAYASPFFAANDDLDVGRALLREIYNLARSRGLQTLLIGFEAKDPMLAVASEYIHLVYPSRIYLAEWPNGESIHEQLDGRPAYIDIATL
jgi:ribosomal protein S18 acetylase RimI-like enzyme